MNQPKKKTHSDDRQLVWNLKPRMIQYCTKYYHLRMNNSRKTILHIARDTSDALTQT